MLDVSEPVDIDVATRHDLEVRLEAAVVALQETALRTRAHGILVTRQGTREVQGRASGPGSIRLDPGAVSLIGIAWMVAAVIASSSTRFR